MGATTAPAAIMVWGSLRSTQKAAATTARPPTLPAVTSNDADERERPSRWATGSNTNRLESAKVKSAAAANSTKPSFRSGCKFLKDIGPL